MPFSKLSKTAQFLTNFAKNVSLFAKSGPKFAKTAPKTLHFGTPSLLRRRFWPKNAGHVFSLTTKTFISPYKNGLGSLRFILIFVPQSGEYNHEDHYEHEENMKVFYPHIVQTA